MENALQIQIVQNLVPVLTADIKIGGGQKITFGDTMTGSGTPASPINVSNDILDQINNNTQTAQDNASQIEEIQDLIPATANQNNPLADQGFVNSSIQTATAYFRGDWATWTDVPSDPELYPVDATGNHTPTTNDYMVVIADEQTNGGTWRYKYTGLWSEQGKSGWQAEYQVNETPFTAAQNAAINSGVTAQAVADISANKTAVANLQTSKQNKLTAGAGITIDGDTISANGDGNYLPLSGGTLTGDIAFGDNAAIGATYLDGLIVKRQLLGSWRNLYYMSSSAISPSDNGNKDLGSSTYKWRRVYVTKLNNGADLIVPAEGGTIARTEDIEAIGGDGTAGQVLTKTADGVAWQDATGGGGASYTAGTGIKIENNQISVDKPVLTNIATKDTSVDILGVGGSHDYTRSVVVGVDSYIQGNDCVSVGYNSTGKEKATAIGKSAQAASESVSIGIWSGNAIANGQAVAIGAYAGVGNYANSVRAVAIGFRANAGATGAIQLGSVNTYEPTTNSDPNTFKVGNANGNFEMMSANGTIPAARHATLPAEDGTYVLKLVIAAGVPTLQWVAK